jgi:hypothetical protein
MAAQTYSISIPASFPTLAVTELDQRRTTIDNIKTIVVVNPSPVDLYFTGPPTNAGMFDNPVVVPGKSMAILPWNVPHINAIAVQGLTTSALTVGYTVFVTLRDDVLPYGIWAINTLQNPGQVTTGQAIPNPLLGQPGVYFPGYVVDTPALASFAGDPLSVAIDPSTNPWISITAYQMLQKQTLPSFGRTSTGASLLTNLLSQSINNLYAAMLVTADFLCQNNFLMGMIGNTNGSSNWSYIDGSDSYDNISGLQGENGGNIAVASRDMQGVAIASYPITSPLGRTDQKYLFMKSQGNGSYFGSASITPQVMYFYTGQLLVLWIWYSPSGDSGYWGIYDFQNPENGFIFPFTDPGGYGGNAGPGIGIRSSGITGAVFQFNDYYTTGVAPVEIMQVTPASETVTNPIANFDVSSGILYSGSPLLPSGDTQSFTTLSLFKNYIVQGVINAQQVTFYSGGSITLDNGGYVRVI